ncbi:MAG: MucB/RseB C-terminal domain-containing protein [Dokdonella sp.]
MSQWGFRADVFAILRTFAICFGLLVEVPALAETPAPLEQLRQMAHSLRALDYEGSFIYQSGARVDTLRIVHSASGDESELLTRLSGPHSEATRHGQSITVNQDGKAPVSFAAGATARLLPLVPADAASLPNNNYRLRMTEPDRVAGYDTNVVDIAATDAYRYSYRLWLDTKHQLPLRVAVLDGNQRTIEQYMFVMFSIGSVLADKGLDASAPIISPAVVVTLGGSARWLVNDVPKGYSLRARQAMSTGKDGEQLVFSDGLASVSAYIELTPEPISDDVALSRGAMNVYIHRDGGWRFTVLGNVPAATVQRIAVSITAVPDRTNPN